LPKKELLLFITVVDCTYNFARRRNMINVIMIRIY